MGHLSYAEVADFVGLAAGLMLGTHTGGPA